MSNGKDLGKRIVKRSEKLGRDVKAGMAHAGTKMNAGARTLGRDVRRAGKKAGMATERGWARAGQRLKRNRRT